jgi:rubrerythrin
MAASNVRVPEKVGLDVPEGFLAVPYSNRNGYVELCLADTTPIVYQGRLDLLVETVRNKLVVVDHKTTSQFGDVAHLEIDTQVSSYAWALRELGIDVYGLMHNQLLKAFPQPPKINQNGKISVDKRQNTTYELYMATIEELGQDPSMYSDMLEHLQQHPKQFVHRIDLHRNAKQLDKQGQMIYDEALDMLNDPNIYPNPNYFNCMGCSFKDPCLANTEGSDVGYFLNDSTLFVRQGE